MNDLFLTSIQILAQILFLATIYYWILRWLKGTQALTHLMSALLSLVAIYAVTMYLKLDVIRWLLEKIFNFLPLIVVILFNAEIRRILGRAAQKLRPRSTSRGNSGKYNDDVVESLCISLAKMSESKTGALIGIEQQLELEEQYKTGKLIDACIVPGSTLLETVFYKGSPLHDGGVVIRKGRLYAAACVFPLCENKQLQSDFGMRHQAAFGLSERTDAIVLVVSEETGAIHFIVDRNMTQVDSVQELKILLNKHLNTNSMDKRQAPYNHNLNAFWNKIKATFRLFRKNRNLSS